MALTIYTPTLTPLLDALSQPVRFPKFTYTGQFMGERKITATLTSPTTLALVSGCYVTFRSETFKLYEAPSAKKTATSATSQSAFEYTLVFYSAQRELATTDFIDIVSDTSHTYFNGGPIVDFVGTVPMLVERLQANLDRIYTGLNAWTITVAAGVDLLESAQISLTDSTVWDALMLVNTTANWGYKFHIRGHVITIGESGAIQDDVTFRYGKSNGLYEISRTNVDSSKIITRLRAYGGTQNIPADYKKDGSGYVAPTYQYIKELSIPAYCYVAGATVNAVGEGIWSSLTQYAIGDLVRHNTDKRRYYAYSVPPLATAPILFDYHFDIAATYNEHDGVFYLGRMYHCNNIGVIGEYPDVSPNFDIDPYFTLWDEGYIESPSSIAEFGIREGILRDESIYPTLKGMEYGGFAADDILAVSPVTSAEQVHFKVWIRDLGFDINDYLTSETPTFTVTRGTMAGNDFEIAKVEPSTLTFSVGTAAYVLTLVRNSQDVFVVPDIDNSVYQTVETIAAVDYLVPVGSSSEDYAKFLLTGISMPNLYVRAAEEMLLTSAQEYLTKYSVQQVTYAIGVDEIQASKNDATWGDGGLLEGDFMGVIDADMGIYGATAGDPKFIIVQSLTITVGDGMVRKYDVVLSDDPVAGTLDAIKSDIKEQGRLVELTGRKTTEDIRKEALTNLYLKAALSGDTEIDGGLVATNLMLLRNIAGIVTGGMSGLKEDPIGFFTGGTYEQAQPIGAEANQAKIIMRKDGSGQLAGGNHRWDASGNTIIEGTLKTAEDGARVEVDNVQNTIKIYDDTEASRVIIAPKNVTTISNLEVGATTITANYAAHAQTLDIDGELELGATESITLANDRIWNVTTPNLPYSLSVTGEYDGVSKIHYNGYAAFVVRLVNTTSGVSTPIGSSSILAGTSTPVIASGTIAAKTISGLAGGVYRIYATLSMSHERAGTGEQNSSVEDTQTLVGVSSVAFSEIGFNGYNFVTSTTDYSHRSDGLTQIRKGDYVFRVSSAGIQKSTNGGSSWTSL